MKLQLVLMIALLTLTSTPASASSTAQTPFEIATDLAISGKYSEAEAMLLPILNEQQPSPKSILLLGRIYLASRDYDKAIEIADKALHINPDGLDELLLSAEAACSKAENSSKIFQALKLGKKCIRWYDKAATNHPHHPEALLYASTIYREAPGFIGGSNKKAKVFFDRLMEQFPEYAKTYQVSILLEEDKQEDAIHMALALAAQNFVSPINQYEIARVLKESKHTEKAKPLFKSLLSSPPKLNTIWYINDSHLQLGQMLIEEQDSLHEGIQLIEQYKAKNQDKRDVHYFWSTWSLAKAYKSDGRLDLYEKLVKQIRQENYKENQEFAKAFDSAILRPQQN